MSPRNRQGAGLAASPPGCTSSRRRVLRSNTRRANGIRGASLRLGRDQQPRKKGASRLLAGSEGMRTGRDGGHGHGSEAVRVSALAAAQNRYGARARAEGEERQDMVTYEVRRNGSCGRFCDCECAARLGQRCCTRALFVQPTTKMAAVSAVSFRLVTSMYVLRRGIREGTKYEYCIPKRKTRRLRCAAQRRAFLSC